MFKGCGSTNGFAGVARAIEPQQPPDILPVVAWMPFVWAIFCEPWPVRMVLLMIIGG
jgi:hypothetical protein